MKRVLCLLTILVCIGATGSSPVVADPAMRGFGFGGAMAMAFFPDMAGINVFMSENGLPPMGDSLIGAGGGGRGGAIGDLAFGGIGWGLVAISDNEVHHAELVFGGGGFDVGAAVGGDENSVLTVGAVFGGGANVVTITDVLADSEGFAPCGVVSQPASREFGRVLGFVQPYISMAAQFLPWMGFDFRIGYIFPVFGINFGDLAGIPAPSLALSGPTVSFGLGFGGIGPLAGLGNGKVGGNVQATSESSGSFVAESGSELIIENTHGDIVISGYSVEATQTAPDRVVEWHAVRTAPKRRIDELQVFSDVTEAGTTLKTMGSGKVDYTLRVPVGVDLRVKNGAGDIRLVSYEAQTIIIENGVGDLSLRHVAATALIVAHGTGEIDLSDVDAQQLIVSLGVGDIALALPADASATVSAKAGFGDVSIDRFPGMTGGVRGFLGKAGDVTLGSGERSIKLDVGLGEIEIEMQEP